jgi:molybdate transport system substrate-binding protein
VTVKHNAMAQEEVERNAAPAGVGSMATRQLLARLADLYERESGRRVQMTSTGGVDAARRLQGGEPFDFAVLASGAIDRLVASGHLVGPRTDIVRSGMAVAVAAGAPRPDIGSEQALRETILRAAHIGYSTGPSGDHLLRLFERWGMAEAIEPRLVRAQPGVPVASLIAKGEVEIGFQQFSELKDVAGVDVLGPLPGEAQLVTVFSGAICAASQQKQAAGAFLAFLASAQAEAIIRDCGMEPAAGG